MANFTIGTALNGKPNLGDGLELASFLQSREAHEERSIKPTETSAYLVNKYKPREVKNSTDRIKPSTKKVVKSRNIRVIPIDDSDDVVDDDFLFEEFNEDTDLGIIKNNTSDKKEDNITAVNSFEKQSSIINSFSKDRKCEAADEKSDVTMDKNLESSQADLGEKNLGVEKESSVDPMKFDAASNPVIEAAIVAASLANLGNTVDDDNSEDSDESQDDMLDSVFDSEDSTEYEDDIGEQADIDWDDAEQPDEEQDNSDEFDFDFDDSEDEEESYEDETSISETDSQSKGKDQEVAEDDFMDWDDSEFDDEDTEELNDTQESSESKKELSRNFDLDFDDEFDSEFEDEFEEGASQNSEVLLTKQKESKNQAVNESTADVDKSRMAEQSRLIEQLLREKEQLAKEVASLKTAKVEAVAKPKISREPVSSPVNSKVSKKVTSSIPVGSPKDNKGINLKNKSDEDSLSGMASKIKIYSGMKDDELYSEVKKFLRNREIQRRPVAKQELYDEFGAENIKKLIVKSYLIQTGKGVTIGR